MTTDYCHVHVTWLGWCVLKINIPGHRTSAKFEAVIPRWGEVNKSKLVWVAEWMSKMCSSLTLGFYMSWVECGIKISLENKLNQTEVCHVDNTRFSFEPVSFIYFLHPFFQLRKGIRQQWLDLQQNFIMSLWSILTLSFWASGPVLDPRTWWWTHRLF